MEASLLSRMKKFCAIEAGLAIALQPHALPARRVVFATDGRIMVLKRDEDEGTLPIPDERSAAHAIGLLDFVGDGWKPLDVSKLRRWAGPVTLPCVCPACDCDERLRVDPCWFGPRIVNRHYLAMVASMLIGGGEARVLFRDAHQPIMIDKDEWRIAIMPMTPSPTHPEHRDDLPRFEV